MSRIRDIANILSASTNMATDAEVTSAISTHNSATDPHGDRAYAASIIPTQTSNSGKYLTTNGSALSWAVIATTPSATPSVLGTVYGYTDTLHENTALGTGSLNLTVTGPYNIAIGSSALTDVTNGSSNIAIGYTSLSYTTSGTDNTSVGQQAMESNLTGSWNVALGSQALNFNETTNNNTAIGSYALYSAQAGSNTAIGWNAGFSVTTGSNNIIIGNDAQTTLETTSNEIVMGNASINKFRIPGLAIDWSTSAYGRATYASTSAPTGGNNGDVWLVYTA